MAEQRIFVCTNANDYLFYPLNADGSVNFAAQAPMCDSGQGQWIAYQAQPAEPEPGPSAVTPEQAAVQIAIVGVGALSAFKGFSVGLIR